MKTHFICKKKNIEEIPYGSIFRYNEKTDRWHFGNIHFDLESIQQLPGWFVEVPILDVVFRKSAIEQYHALIINGNVISQGQKDNVFAEIQSIIIELQNIIANETKV